MSNGQYSTDSIVEFIYSTPDEAIAKAREWGFDGYRTYLINGEIKYVPCETTADYLQATRLYVHQGDIVAQGKEVFGDKLVGYQFTDKDTIKGDPIFTLGNFTITTTAGGKEDKIYTLADTARAYTAADFTKDGIEALKAQITKSVTANVRFDKTNLEKYVTYSSLSERFRVCLQEIAETFPASIHVIPYSITNTSVYDYFVYPNGDASTFKVRISDINNPYTIDYFKTGATAIAPEYITPLRNFTKNYAKYEVYYKGTAYPIVGIIPPTSSSDPNGLVLTVSGNPFGDDVSINNTANVNFYIKPNSDAFDSFYENATDLSAYLLNPKSDPLYIATFNVPHRLENGTFQIIPKSLRFPMYDDFNVDIFGDAFDAYTTDLYFSADEFDRYKTDLIARFLTSESLQEYDTEDRKAYVTLQAYGYMFDNVKKFADGIAYMTNVSYDKIDNIPDVLLKNFAHTLGWKTYEIESDETLVESLFNVSVDRQGDDTPQEIDIELWRRILINSFYLFKSKGTRKSIEFALELVGIPIEIMDINEYVYTAQHPLDYTYYYNVFHGLIDNYPIDRDGYPTVPPNVYFQAYGGSMLNNAQNIGPYDWGQTYIDAFRKFSSLSAFDLERTVDNKKVWVNTSTETNRTYDLLLRNTNYTITDSRLVINTKEADASISSQMTFDYYVYSFYKDNNYSISVSGVTIEPAKLSFNDYLREITSKLIDPKNRKVIKTYPVLSKIYWDYLDYAGLLGKKTIDYTKTLDFIRQFDSYWVKLVQQFVPATTIFLAGKKYSNANVTKSKFQYKHGLNDDLSWMGTDGSEFQADALKPSLQGNSDLFKYDAYIGENLRGNNLVFRVECILSEPARSYLARGGRYDAYDYSFYRHYGETANILEERHGNYGTLTGLTLNPPIHAEVADMYIFTKTPLGTIDVGNEASFTGTTTDDLIGVGAYAGYATSGTTGSVVMTIDALPTSGALYPLIFLLLFGLRDVNVEPDEYYVAEGDIMMEFQVSGNTVHSYIGLVPTYLLGHTHPSPDIIVSDFDIQEGCKGAGEYEKYNWVHMKTKFKPTESSVNIVLAAKDINYHGTGKLSLKNFTVKKETIDIDFITPPPYPHVCFYDMDGMNLVPFDTVVTNETFGVGWTASYNGTCWAGFGGGSAIFTGGTGSGIVQTAIYDSPPNTDNLYYYAFDVDVLAYAGTSLSYAQMPTVSFYPFMSSMSAINTYVPLKFKASFDGSKIRYEGFILPTTGAGAPVLTDTIAPPSWVTRFTFNNTTALSSTYKLGLSNFIFRKVNIFYRDANEDLFWYKQPYGFGYSRNTNEDPPDYAIGGSEYNWIIPYLPTGHTGEAGDLAGVYLPYVESFIDTTPLMQVNQTYVDKYDMDTTDSTIDINLTHTCGLSYKFYKDTGYPASCVMPEGATIENQNGDDELFMSGTLSFDFEGFYPTTGSTLAGLGPFYTAQSVYALYGNLGGSNVSCLRRQDTKIPIINSHGSDWETLRNDTGYTLTHPHVPEDFKTEVDTVALANRSNNHYLVVNRYNLIKVEASLIYDSDTDTDQVVYVKLVGAGGFVYNQKSYVVGGSNNDIYAPTGTRTINYTFEGMFYVNDEIYIVVYPTEFDCTIKEADETDITGYYTLSGSTDKTVLIAGKMQVSGDWLYTYFTGDTYQYMYNSVYDTIKFTPEGVYGATGSTATADVYGTELEYYMAYVSGATATGKTMVLQSNPVDRSQYSSKNQFMYGVMQLPPPFTGGTYNTYTDSAVQVDHPYQALTGTTFTVSHKSYIKVYESNVLGINSTLERQLIAFYKKNGVLTFKDGYSKNFFDDPINRFYAASDVTSREVFPYGSTVITTELDGVHLIYTFAKDLAGYPVSGEFIARLTAYDPCGNFATIYLLLCINVKDGAYANRIGNTVIAQLQIQTPSIT